VLAVSPGTRSTAIVCLSARFRLSLVKVVAPRKRSTTATRTVRREIEAAIRACDPATLVIETGRRGAASHVLRHQRRAALEAGRLVGLRVREVRFVDACVALTGSARADAPLPTLVDCYPEISARLDPSRPNLFRNPDQRRELRPLIAAATLAHAIALQAIAVIGPEALGPVQ
jgi:hypothetical protein